MKNKSFWLGSLLGFLVSFVVICVIAAVLAYNFFGIRMQDVTSEVTTGVVENVDNASTSLDLDKINQKITRLEGLVDRYYLFQEDTEKVEDGIYKGLMAGLDDPYSVYYNKKDYEAVTADSNGIYSGIGAVVSRNANTGLTSVIRVFEGSPAEEAGVQAGDIIYKVNGEDVTMLELDVLVSSYIRGEEGTKVEVTFLRGDEREEVTLSITRRSIEVPSVEHKMLDNKVGYIMVSQFDVVTYEQFVHAVDDLTNQGMVKLVVDLRSNPGGILETCVRMMDYVLPDGLLVYTADKDGKGDKYYSEDGHQLDIPMAILIDKNSASASEVFTGAVKDFEKAVVVGEKTFGKGIVQNLIPLGDGSAIKLTTQHYYTPSGFDLHGKGIEPDIAVELDKDAKIGDPATDNQLQEAIRAME